MKYRTLAIWPRSSLIWPQSKKSYMSAPLFRGDRNSATLAAKVAQKRGEIATLTSGLESARAQVEVQRELVEMQDSLKSLGTGSRKSWLEAKVVLFNAATATGSISKASSIRRKRP